MDTPCLECTGASSCKVVYMDYMGAGLYTRRQIEETFFDSPQPAMGNPHSSHPMGTATRDEIAAARKLVLDFFGAVEEYSVIFCSGCTGALKLVADSFPFNVPGATFAIHFASHNSVVGMREVACGAGATYVGTFDSPSDYREALRLHKTEEGPHLVVYPLECNFSGSRYPLGEWANVFHNAARRRNSDGTDSSDVFVCVDGAAAAAKMPIKLDSSGVDLFACSFYKMFGYPTGLGALLVRNDAAHFCFSRKRYFGGGTVEYVVPSRAGLHQLRRALHERLEDGTPNFHAIHALRAGFCALERCGGVGAIEQRIESIVSFGMERLQVLRHGNGTPVVRILRDDASYASRGSSIAFVVVDSDGSVIGHSLVEQLAALHGIMLRSGCFCNPGACQKYLSLSDDDILKFASAGHVCWDEHNIVDGKPTGCTRASFGSYSSKDDVVRLVNFLSRCFLRASPTGMSTLSVPASLSATVRRRHYIVKHIEVFPVKGTFGFSPPQWPLTPLGLLYDREWMIISAVDCAALTPKRNIRITLLDVSLSVRENVLVITCRDRNMSPLRIVADEERSVQLRCNAGRCIAHPSGTAHKDAIIRGRTLSGYRHYSAEVNSWISAAVGCDALLVRCGSDNFKNNGQGSLLVVDWRSHECVVSETPKEERQRVTWHAYRANIVLQAAGATHQPSFLDHMRIATLELGQGPIILRGLAPCHRCTQLGVQRDATIFHQPLTSISSLCRAAGHSSAVFGKLFAISSLPQEQSSDASEVMDSTTMFPKWAWVVGFVASIVTLFLSWDGPVTLAIIQAALPPAVVGLLLAYTTVAHQRTAAGGGSIRVPHTFIRIGMDVTAQHEENPEASSA